MFLPEGWMMVVMEQENLVRLGEKVVLRRRERGWPTRQAFAGSVDLSYRTVSDLENGSRQLGPKAYAKIEDALAWQPGSVDRILAGGEPFDPDDAVASKIRHPSRAVTISHLAEDDPGVADVLSRVLSGDVDDEVRSDAKRILEDMEISQLPGTLAHLSREGRLSVARFASKVFAEEFGKQVAAGDS